MARLWGIGTCYWGKGEPFERVARCPICQSYAQLSSYSAMKFFVVFMLPVLPLGRWRVLDECSRCGRHRSLKLRDWKQKNAQLRATQPDFLEAVCAYQCRQVFDRQAEGLGRSLDADEAKLVELARVHTFFGQHRQAEACLRRAVSGHDSLELGAELGLNLLRQGRLSEATDQLETILTQADPGQVRYLYFLIEAYQLKGQHYEAERLLDRMAEVWPDLADNPLFQSYEERVERYLNSRSRVPSPALGFADLRPSLAARVTAVVRDLAGIWLFIVLLAFQSWSLGQARVVYLVNGLSSAYDVELQGARYRVYPAAALPVTIHEGPLQLKVLSPEITCPGTDLTVSQSFWIRPFSRSVYVVNPDRLALLLRRPIRYSQSGEAPTEREQLLTGQELYTLSDVDFVFEKAPGSIEVIEDHHHHLLMSLLGKSDRWDKWELSLCDEPLVARLLLIDHELGRAALVTDLTRRLQAAPATPEVMSAACQFLPARELLELIQPHLELQPVQTVWHRAYQDLSAQLDPKRDLIREYRQRLARTPSDHALQYLLGRLLDSHQLWQRSVSGSDPCVFGFAVLAREALAQADFQTAEGLTRQGLACKPTYPELFEDDRGDALWGLGRWDELVSHSPGDVSALVASGREEAARKLVEQARGTLAARLLAELTYACGDFQTFAARAGEAGSYFDFAGKVVGGHLAEAASEVEAVKAWQLHLVVYLAASQAQQRPLAGQELKRSIRLLQAASTLDERRMGSLLEHPTAAKPALDVVARPLDKRIFLAAMGLRDQAHRMSYDGLARKLNFRLNFPYWTVREVIQ